MAHPHCPSRCLKSTPWMFPWNHVSLWVKLYLYMWTYVCIYIYMHAHGRCTHTCICTCIYIYINLFTPVSTCICVNGTIYTQVHIHINTTMYIYIHTHPLKCCSSAGFGPGCWHSSEAAHSRHTGCRLEGPMFCSCLGLGLGFREYVQVYEYVCTYVLT